MIAWRAHSGVGESRGTRNLIVDRIDTLDHHAQLSFGKSIGREWLVIFPALFLQSDVLLHLAPPPSSFTPRWVVTTLHTDMPRSIAGFYDGADHLHCPGPFQHRSILSTDGSRRLLHCRYLKSTLTCAYGKSDIQRFHMSGNEQRSTI